jgi:hypothetical protein
MDKRSQKVKITLTDVLQVMQKGFTRIEENMATKQDLTNLEERVNKRMDTMATKMATKEDIKYLESKMATKDDLETFKRGIIRTHGNRLSKLEKRA